MSKSTTKYLRGLLPNGINSSSHRLNKKMQGPIAYQALYILKNVIRNAIIPLHKGFTVYNQLVILGQLLTPPLSAIMFYVPVILVETPP